MPRVFKASQRLIAFDDAGLYEPTAMLLAATGWVLQAARDTDPMAQAGTRLAHVAGAVDSNQKELLGDAFENAIVDLVGDGHTMLPQLREAIAIVAGYADFYADFSTPRVIALIANRRRGSLLRASYDDAMQLVSDDARVLTPYAGRPPTIWATSHNRLADLLEASTSGRPPRSLAGTPTIAKLHFADLLLGSNDGTAWIGVDLKSGGRPCTPTNAGVHLGISEQPPRAIMDSTYALFEQHVSKRGYIPTFVELQLGTWGTPLGRLSEALGLMKPLAALRAGSNVSKWQLSEEHRETLARLQPLVDRPLDDVIEALLPWSAQAVEEILVPSIGFDPEPPPGVSARLN